MAVRQRRPRFLSTNVHQVDGQSELPISLFGTGVRQRFPLPNDTPSERQYKATSSRADFPAWSRPSFPTSSETIRHSANGYGVLLSSESDAVVRVPSTVAGLISPRHPTAGLAVTAYRATGIANAFLSYFHLLSTVSVSCIAAVVTVRIAQGSVRAHE